jgi:hypothetical protein
MQQCKFFRIQFPALLSVQKHNIVEIIIRELNLFGCCCCCLLLFNKRGNKVGFPLANFLARSDLFPLSVSLITSQDVAKWMPTKEKGLLNDSLCAEKFASGKPA